MTTPHVFVRNADIQSGANRFARALDALGVPTRGNVAVLLPNVPEFLWCYRGAGWSGRRLTPMSWHWSADDARYVVDNCEADVLVAHARFAPVARAAGAALPGGRRIAVGGPIDGFLDWDVVVAGHDDAPLGHPLAGDTLLYTSGTTGRPKGVLRAVPADEEPPTRVGRSGMAMIRQFLPSGSDRVHLVVSPLYHAGPVSYCEGAALLGADIVLVDGWDAGAVLSLIARYRVTSTFLVPIHFVRLLRLPSEVRARADLSSLRLVIHGAAPTAPAVKQAMIEWFGPVLYEFYGGTEGGGCSISSEDWLRKPGSVGRPFPHLELHVLDDDRQPCDPGQTGTVWFRQPEGFVYKDAPEQTASAQYAGLVTLGDIGHVDDEGFLFLSDRRADVIVSGGVNVYPAQIEAVLLAHPAVGDCCVVGIPDDEWGESVHAVVLAPLTPPAGLAAELLTWCRARLGGHQVPRSIELRDELPRTDTGKLARRMIRDPFWADRGRRI